MTVEVTEEMIAFPRMHRDSPGNPLELALRAALKREGRLRGRVTASTTIAIHELPAKGESEVWGLPDDAALLVCAWIRGWPMCAGEYDIGEPKIMGGSRSGS